MKFAKTLVILAFVFVASFPVNIFAEIPEKTAKLSILSLETPRIVGVSLFPDRPYGPETSQKISVSLIPIAKISRVTAIVELEEYRGAYFRLIVPLYQVFPTVDGIGRFEGEYKNPSTNNDVVYSAFRVTVAAVDRAGNTSKNVMVLQSMIKCSPSAEGDWDVSYNCLAGADEKEIFVNGNIIIREATLTIPEGVTVQLSYGHSVILGRGGSLVLSNGARVLN